MAGIRSCTWSRPLQTLPCSNWRAHSVQCFSPSPNDKSKETPQLLKIAVSGLTEIIRLFPSKGRDRSIVVDNEWKDEVSVSNVNDVLAIIKSDYEKAYFVTGLFTSTIYAEDCTFEDPTIKFQGTKLYARNLSLLVPFFINPSIQLREIEKGPDSEAVCLVASWRLRTYLKLPWKPLISIDGKTVYDLNKEFRIVGHTESWSISALEAITQIFTPSSGRSNEEQLQGSICISYGSRWISLAKTGRPTVIEFVNDSEAFEKWVNEKFSTVDSNGDGLLSRDELQKRDGKLSSTEFELQSKEEITTLYDVLFEKFDIDGSGTIDLDEFRSLMKEIIFVKAHGIGDSPVCIILQGDSLLMRAVQRANA